MKIENVKLGKESEEKELVIRSILKKTIKKKKKRDENFFTNVTSSQPLVTVMHHVKHVKHHSTKSH